jgi:hypothetical protein
LIANYIAFAWRLDIYQGVLVIADLSCSQSQAAFPASLQKTPQIGAPQ